jgi:hypothetical protein
MLVEEAWRCQARILDETRKGSGEGVMNRRELGVALFFGASGLSGLWMLARAAGQPRRSPGSAV